jgi:hypothetical protein
MGQSISVHLKEDPWSASLAYNVTRTFNCTPRKRVPHGIICLLSALRLQSHAHEVRIPVQVDIGYGDPVTPSPIRLTYPTLLDFPAPTLRAYPPETVIAEQFHATVRFGIVNTRMKDFFDIWILSRQFEFDGDTLGKALDATFKSLKTDLPAPAPPALSEDFTNDPAKKTQ